MKVLLINNTLEVDGGVTAYVKNLYRLLLRHKVKVFACTDTNNFNNYLNVEPDILPRPTHLHGLRMLSDSMRYYWNFEAAKLLRQYLNSFKPDIVHLHAYHGHLTSSILTELKRKKLPVVQTLHGFIDLCPVEKMQRNGKFCNQCAVKGLHRAIINKCNDNSIIRSSIVASESLFRNRLNKNKIDHYICVSDFQRNVLKQYYQEWCITTLENFTYPNYPSDVMTDQEFLLYPTRLIKDKGIERLIKIYQADNQNELPKVKIVGTGAMQQFFAEKILSEGLEDRIELCEFKKSDELNLLYQKCLAVINFSALYETFGLTVIEAMASNKHTFVSNDGAMPTIVDDHTGTVLDFQNDAVVNVKIMLEKLEMLRHYTGKEIFATFQKRFSPEVHVAKLEQIYIETLNKCSKRAS